MTARSLKECPLHVGDLVRFAPDVELTVAVGPPGAGGLPTFPRFALPLAGRIGKVCGTFLRELPRYKIQFQYGPLRVTDLFLRSELIGPLVEAVPQPKEEA